MKTLSGKTFLLIWLCFTSLMAPAQPGLSKIELGANAIAFIYQGDLTPSKLGSFKTIMPGLGIFGSYKLNNTFYLRTSIAVGRLSGDDSKYKTPAWRQQRNFKFKSPITEVSESAVWNILPAANVEGPKLSPYLSAGIGYAFLHIKRDYSNYNIAYFGEESVLTTRLKEDTAHTLPRGLLIFPVGLGARYSISANISLNAEFTYRLNSTDYLDGFSQAGNPARKDHYFSNSIGFIYSFDKKNWLKCPKMRY